MEHARGRVYPVLPLRDIVVYPHMIVPLFVGRARSVRALEAAMAGDKTILLLAQREAGQNDPQASDLYSVGTIGTVLQLLKLPDGTVKVLVEGGERAKLLAFVETEDSFAARAEPLSADLGDPKDVEVLARTAIAQFEQYIKLNKKIPPEVLVSLNQVEDPAKLADTIAAHLALKIPEKQTLLEAPTVAARLERIYQHMESEIGLLQVEKSIRGRVKRQVEHSQREYFLNEQMKAIHKELGQGEDGKDEFAELSERLARAKMPQAARDKAVHELRKLRSMGPMSAEATVVRSYLDWMAALPWGKRGKLSSDLAQARAVLDADHYGLDKVKERILEYLAVQQRVGRVKGPILCLVGPPGVGKTSLAKSIARATNRTFVRMSLGGVRDEAEMRGHRRTYVGSMPGKIVQGLRRAGSSNPLFLLDELDKLGADHRGDPASALLEILDPAQNAGFQDHYLELEYDLSDVMFVTTANTLRMPRPLLDRMEIIRLPGYTEDEKLAIARRHLLPKQMRESGLAAGEWRVSDGALRELIRSYTREAGVRNLEREIGNLARKAVKQIGLGQATRIAVTRRNLGRFAGVPRYRFGMAEREDVVGVATGLAWTEVGGELLTIETVVVPGKGRISSTGRLGEVMKESIQAADTFVRARAESLGIPAELLRTRDVHVHVPEGAVPKDGPSAGIAMVTAIVSALTGTPVRRNVAMTGEVTLRGRVLPVGGLKEKLLAAARGGLDTVLIPRDNADDLSELPANIRNSLTIVPVATVEGVLRRALVEPPKPIAAPDATPVEPPPQAPAAKPRTGVVTH